ncbi:MAG TPA: hypothetical protein VMN82_15810 [Thermoanaerobaculia bacterium]|nr:hypothetical protein [Thermoanaerobaculia bacterium]
MRRLSVLLSLGLVLVLAGCSSSSSSTSSSTVAPKGGTLAVDGPKPMVVYQAWALNMLGGGGGTTVTIGIYRWTTDAERSALINVLKTEGNAELVADMSQLPQVGYIYTQGTLAYALFYARENVLPDGTKQIVLATNRPLSFAGAIAPGARQKYDLGIAELRIPTKGEGEGKVIVQGMATIDDKTGKIEINNYSGQPTRLMQIRAIPQ